VAELKVPELGESVVEATVGRWLKQEGEAVSPGEPVVELETDKVNLEVAAETAGVITKILAPEGSTVAVGSSLATIEASATAAPPAAAPPVTDTAPAVDEGVRATPDVRRLAKEQGVDLARLQGSGPKGRIVRDDVLAATKPPENPVLPPPAPRAPQPEPRVGAQSPDAAWSERHEEHIPMSSRRLTIARRLVEAQHQAAMLTTFNEVDMSTVLTIRQRRRDAFKERYGVSLGLMSFFTKAVIGALKAFPRLNAEIRGQDMIIKHYYDIGIAVATDQGLVVPVLRNADRMTFAEIEQHVAELARRARDNKLTLDELKGGTFTITNGGVFGSLLSTPILNAPQVGILGMHKIQERPVAVNGQVEIRPMMYIALSYDHRIVDGSEAVRFLVTVKQFIEDPEALLLEG